MQVRRSTFWLSTSLAVLLIVTGALLPFNIKMLIGVDGNPLVHVLIHLTVFFCLAVWVGRHAGSPTLLPGVMIFVSLLGSFTEWLEAHLYHFQVERIDIALDILASLLGSVLAWWMIQRKTRYRTPA